MNLKVKKLHPDAKIPTRAHEGDLGYDLYANESMILPLNQVVKVKTDIAVEFPEGWGAMIKDRSSMASKGITTSGGIIDNGFSGPLTVMLTYQQESTNDPSLYRIAKGDKIAQMIPTQVVDWDVVEVEEISENGRGSNGFGSSGK